MAQLGWYNGYSPAEREKSFSELKRVVSAGIVPWARGPCRLCLDAVGTPDQRSGACFEYHSESYDLPVATKEPYLIVLCIHCHRAKLHKRFSNPWGWKSFLAHINRGGYARDLKSPEIAMQVRKYRLQIEEGQEARLEILRSHEPSDLLGWFASLSTNPGALTCKKQRTSSSHVESELG